MFFFFSQCNFSIIVVNILFEVFYLALLMGIMWQVYTAAMNGHVEANPHMDPNYRDDPKLCYVRDEPDDDNNSFLNKSSGGGGSKLIHKIAPCCIWIFDDGVIAWITVAAILLSWLSFLVFQLRVFVTSGTSTNTTFHLGRERERERKGRRSYVMSLFMVVPNGLMIRSCRCCRCCLYFGYCMSRSNRTLVLQPRYQLQRQCWGLQLHGQDGVFEAGW